MKLILPTLLALFVATPAFSCDKCEKHAKDKKQDTVLAEKCDKKCDDDCKKKCDKDEPALADKCKKCDGKDKDEPTLA